MSFFLLITVLCFLAFGLVVACLANGCKSDRAIRQMDRIQKAQPEETL